jgi:hypothetical protein
MSWLEWTFGVILFMLYVVCLFTVCSLTFQKGYTLLGIIGIFFPFLWLIGAIMPAKKGSRYDIAEQMRYRQAMNQMTQ